MKCMNQKCDAVADTHFGAGKIHLEVCSSCWRILNLMVTGGPVSLRWAEAQSPIQAAPMPEPQRNASDLP